MDEQMRRCERLKNSHKACDRAARFGTQSTEMALHAGHSESRVEQRVYTACHRSRHSHGPVHTALGTGDDSSCTSTIDYYAERRAAHSTLPDGQKGRSQGILAYLSHELPKASWPPTGITYSQLIQKVVKEFYLSPKDKPNLKNFDDIIRYISTSREEITLPVHEFLLDIKTKIWQTPMTSPPTTKWLETKYKVQSAPGYDKPQLHHYSAIAELVRQNSRYARCNTPPDRDLKTLDLVGKKVFQGAMLSSRIAAHQFQLLRYFYTFLEKARSLTSLSLGIQHQLSVIFQDMEECVKCFLMSFIDAYDTSCRTAAVAISARRMAWLRAAGVSEDIQERLVDAPCTGKDLFEKVHEIINEIKEERALLEAVSVHPPDQSSTASCYRRSSCSRKCYRPY